MTKQKTFPKRMLCVILTLCMIVSCMAGMTFTVSAATYTPTETLQQGDNYRLTKDVTLSTKWEVTLATDIDLNGHTITMTGEGYIKVNSLTRKVTFQNGTIKGSSDLKNSPFEVYSGELILKGVKLNANGTQQPGIRAYSGSKVTTEKHETNGNTEINNFKTTGNGGAVFVNNGTLKMSDTNIFGCSAGNGGAVYSTFGESNLTEMTFISCKMTNNTATTKGGAIYSNAKTLNIQNCEITNNKIISANQNYGAGVFVGTDQGQNPELRDDSMQTITATKITGNYANNAQKQDGKLLPSNFATYKQINLSTGGLNTNAMIGIVNLINHKSDADYSGEFIYSADVSKLKTERFTSDIEGYTIVHPTSSNYMYVKKSRTLTVNNGNIGSETSGVTTKTLGQGDYAWVWADKAPEGKLFDHWEATGITLDKTNKTSDTYYKNTKIKVDMPDNDVSLVAVFVNDPNVEYTIKLSDAKAYNQSGTQITKAAAGQRVTIKADDVEHAKFSYWNCFGPNIEFDDPHAKETTFIMPSLADTVYTFVTILAEFDYEHQITVENGTASKDYAWKDDIVTVTANEAPEGKTFDKWEGTYSYVNHTKVVTENIEFTNATSPSTTFKMPNYDADIKATFKTDARQPHRINLTKCTVEGITPDEYGNYFAKENDIVTVTAAEPEIGKIFKEWTGTYYDSVKHEYKNIEFTNKAAETTTFFMPDDIVYIEALYIDDGITRYDITVDKGTATPAKAAKGETVTLKADEPETGMKFDKWRTLPAGEVTFADPTAAETTFVMPDKPVVIVADFKAASGVKHSISVTDGTADKTEAADGEIVTVTANPAPAGKIFDNWSSSDGITFADPNATVTTFTMPDKAVSITANYTDDIYAKHTITVLDGTASPALAALNETVTVTADTPETGMVFYKWRSVPDGSVTFADQTASTTTFPMIAENVVIVATFKSTDSTKHTISVVDGTATPDTAAAGETITVKANDPELGMEFDQWKCVPAGSVTFADPYASVTTFTMPDEYVVAVATYKIKAVTVPDFVMGSTAAPNFKAVTKAINAQVKAGTAKDAYIIEIPATFTEKSVALPKGNFSITLTGGKIVTGSITANCDTIISCTIAPASKVVNIKAAANKTVKINKAGSFGTISGGKGSKLIVGADITAETVKTFDSVETGFNTITVTKTMSGAVIVNASLKYNTALAKKITIPAITGNLVITLEGSTKSGTPIFTYSGSAFDNSKVTILNTDEGKLLEAFLYKKEVRAEIPDLFLLNGDDCPSWEFALTRMTDANTDYTITLTGNTKVSKFALPAKAKSLTINGADMTLDLDKTKSITAKCKLTLNNITIVASGTPVAVKTGKFDLTLNDANVGAVTAGKLTVNGNVVANGAVSVTELNSELTGTHFTIQSLAITKNGITTGSEGIMLKLINKTGATVKLAAGTKNNVAVKTFKPATYVEGSLLLDSDCIESGTGLLKFEKNKLILT